ncbi:hypothetical protein QWY31_02965 [Cytophagales bacterium LB-30]|uniref:Uncharacterized protein n=1 Tax=Shiella aurantiaca TaxID=3058365 RepID=A0ABT8F1X6_9BACT|nr:hypothetical protein [Shiella aurantiaca]MDN4164443.1 hypothetical protein [Shiella aurantiaca]
MGYITTDESKLPLVKVTINFGNPSFSDYKLFLDFQIKLLSIKHPFVLYMDARKLGYLSSDIRMAQGKYFKDYKIELNTYCVGTIMLVKSTLASLMFKAVSVMENPPGETYITSDEMEALNKIEELLNKTKAASFYKHYFTDGSGKRDALDNEEIGLGSSLYL